MLPFKRLDPLTPSAVSRLLPLANKYCMDALRARIVQHIEQDWPQSLAQWDQLEGEIEVMIEGRRIDRQSSCMLLDDCLPEPASAIRLGRECNIPSILPAAFYHLSRLSVFNDKQVKSPDATAELTKRSADWHSLDVTDLICLLKGRFMLSVALNAFLRPWRPDNADHFSEICTTLRQHQLWADIKLQCSHSSDILLTLRRLGMQTYDEVCYACCRSIQMHLHQLRREIWARLPEFFVLHDVD